ncbi:hypothetical protein M011DRAFT_458339 [Sporormia fimetaria CBS 119925]|uniref:Uncharacterized protein n=1 Tax=Sporormia fimetaria CBS 119925 TaxID=1340428 RepID=A0A6A6VA20_9PLEO|nr:hypothetical protein M011DRAFT_458339 [Sporormia fimetaria CBS 119925]
MVSRHPQHGTESEDIDPRLNREANNHRLRTAINYITNHGRNDSDDLYEERVKKIYKHILVKFHNQGYVYDGNLFEQLQRMVLKQIATFESGYEGVSSSSDEEEGLTRAASPMIPVGKQRGAPRPLAKTRRAPPKRVLPAKKQISTTMPPKPRPREPDEEPPREKTWLYGGPNNDPEIWNNRVPSLLPFPQTFTGQLTESHAICYDLKQGPQRASGALDTKVSYKDAKNITSHDRDIYQSVSRFPLPKPDPEIVAIAKDFDGEGALDDLVETWRDGKDSDRRIKKGYVPRIFLPAPGISTVAFRVYDETVTVERAVSPGPEPTNPTSPVPSVPASASQRSPRTANASSQEPSNIPKNAPRQRGRPKTNTSAASTSQAVNKGKRKIDDDSSASRPGKKVALQTGKDSSAPETLKAATRGSTRSGRVYKR